MRFLLTIVSLFAIMFVGCGDAAGDGGPASDECDPPSQFRGASHDGRVTLVGSGAEHQRECFTYTYEGDPKYCLCREYDTCTEPIKTLPHFCGFSEETERSSHNLTNSEVAMSKTATDRISEVNEFYKKQGAEFVGTVVSLSVQMGEDVVPLRDIQNLILNTPELPNEWKPRPRNKLSLYLDTINQLKNSASFQKFAAYQDEFPFDPDEHFGYLGKRIRYKKHESIPVAHKIVHLRRSEAEAMGFEDLDISLVDYDVDEGIVIMLERVEGTEETDDTTSKFRITFNADVPDEYNPFLLALRDRYKQRLNQVYDSSAIRDVILDMVKDKMNAQSINTGTYFIDSAEAAQLDALKAGFAKIHPDIDLFTLHVAHYKDRPANHPTNQNFSSVRKRLTDSVVGDLKNFVDDLKERRDSETDTRRSTWNNRANELREMKKRVKKFRAKQVLEADILEDLLAEASTVLKKQLEAA